MSLVLGVSSSQSMEVTKGRAAFPKNILIDRK
jgi:hypothetical protein